MAVFSSLKSTKNTLSRRRNTLYFSIQPQAVLDVTQSPFDCSVSVTSYEDYLAKETFYNQYSLVGASDNLLSDELTCTELKCNIPSIHTPWESLLLFFEKCRNATTLDESFWGLLDRTLIMGVVMVALTRTTFSKTTDSLTLVLHYKMVVICGLVIEKKSFDFISTVVNINLMPHLLFFVKIPNSKEITNSNKNDIPILQIELETQQLHNFMECYEFLSDSCVAVHNLNELPPNSTYVHKHVVELIFSLSDTSTTNKSSPMTSVGATEVNHISTGHSMANHTATSETSSNKDPSVQVQSVWSTLPDLYKLLNVFKDTVVCTGVIISSISRTGSVDRVLSVDSWHSIIHSKAITVCVLTLKREIADLFDESAKRITNPCPHVNYSSGLCIGPDRICKTISENTSAKNDDAAGQYLTCDTQSSFRLDCTAPDQIRLSEYSRTLVNCRDDPTTLQKDIDNDVYALITSNIPHVDQWFNAINDSDCSYRQKDHTCVVEYDSDEYATCDELLCDTTDSANDEECFMWDDPICDQKDSKSDSHITTRSGLFEDKKLIKAKENDSGIILLSNTDGNMFCILARNGSRAFNNTLSCSTEAHNEAYCGNSSLQSVFEKENLHRFRAELLNDTSRQVRLNMSIPSSLNAAKTFSINDMDKNYCSPSLFYRTQAFSTPMSEKQNTCEAASSLPYYAVYSRSSLITTNHLTNAGAERVSLSPILSLESIFENENLHRFSTETVNHSFSKAHLNMSNYSSMSAAKNVSISGMGSNYCSSSIFNRSFATHMSMNLNATSAACLPSYNALNAQCSQRNNGTCLTPATSGGCHLM